MVKIICKGCGKTCEWDDDGLCEDCGASELFDYSEIEDECNYLLKDIEKRIKLCLKDTNKDKEKGIPPGMDWRAEALGYKTSLECIKRTREKFGLNTTEGGSQ